MLYTIAENLLTLSPIYYFTDWLADQEHTFACIVPLVQPCSHTKLEDTSPTGSHSHSVDFLQSITNCMPAVVGSGQELCNPVFRAVSLLPPYQIIIDHR